MPSIMKKHKYFELAEFIRSDTARERGIDNTPTFEIVQHLDELVEDFLDPLRAAYGAAVYVSSGFRCPALNEAVGGAEMSVHKIGYAADLTVRESFEKFVAFVVTWVRRTGRKFDQILIERDAQGHQWLHIGLYNNTGQQRGLISVMNK